MKYRIVAILLGALLIWPWALCGQETSGSIDAKRISEQKDAQWQELTAVRRTLNQINKRDISIKDGPEKTEAISFLEKIDESGQRLTKVFEARTQKIKDFFKKIGSPEYRIQRLIFCLVITGIIAFFALKDAKKRKAKTTEKPEDSYKSLIVKEEPEIKEVTTHAQVAFIKEEPKKFDFRTKAPKRMEKAVDWPFNISCNEEEWLELAKAASVEMPNLWNEKGLQQVQSYVEKKGMIINNRPIEIALDEASKAKSVSLKALSTNGETFLSAVVKGKGINSNKEGKTLFNNELDTLFIYSLSKNNGEVENNEFWDRSQWNFERDN